MAVTVAPTLADTLLRLHALRSTAPNVRGAVPATTPSPSLPQSIRRRHGMAPITTTPSPADCTSLFHVTYYRLRPAPGPPFRLIVSGQR
jgi:hypothetical protein